MLTNKINKSLLALYVANSARMLGGVTPKEASAVHRILSDKGAFAGKPVTRESLVLRYRRTVEGGNKRDNVITVLMPLGENSEEVLKAWESGTSPPQGLMYVGKGKERSPEVRERNLLGVCPVTVAKHLKDAGADMTDLSKVPLITLAMAVRKSIKSATKDNIHDGVVLEYNPTKND
jgi:hypothetical protein